MTGFRSSGLDHACDSKGCYIEQLPWWDDLVECFPSGIGPTDIDGMVELNSRFLFLEEKSAGVGIKNGQRLALKRLCTLPGVTAVIFRPGKESDLECLVFSATEALLPGWEPYDGFRPHTRNEFHVWLQEWSYQASASLT